MIGTDSRGLVLDEPLLFEQSQPGRIGFSLPEADVPHTAPAAELLRDEITGFPELSEVDVYSPLYGACRPGTMGSIVAFIPWAAAP